MHACLLKYLTFNVMTQRITLLRMTLREAVERKSPTVTAVYLKAYTWGSVGLCFSFTLSPDNSICPQCNCGVIQSQTTANLPVRLHKCKSELRSACRSLFCAWLALVWAPRPTVHYQSNQLKTIVKATLSQYNAAQTHVCPIRRSGGCSLTCARLFEQDASRLHRQGW